MVGGKFNFSESRYTDIDAQYPSGRQEQFYWQREWYGTSGVAYKIGHLEASYAADYINNSLNSNLKTMNRVRREAVLQSVSWRYSNRNVTATARLAAHFYRTQLMYSPEKPKEKEQKFTPMFSFSWRVLTDSRAMVALRAFYQELFRMPSFSESCFYHLGNQHLRPELTRQIGTGVAFSLHEITPWWSRFSVTADGYYNRISDKIMSVPYNLFVWHTVNLGKSVAGGMDVTLESHWNLAKNQA